MMTLAIAFIIGVIVGAGLVETLRETRSAPPPPCPRCVRRLTDPPLQVPLSYRLDRWCGNCNQSFKASFLWGQRAAGQDTTCPNCGIPTHSELTPGSPAWAARYGMSHE